MQLKNPMFPGFHPDPCFCRKGDDYYLAVSSFEWFPGVPVYHSRDLCNWELYSHCLTDASCPDLGRLPSAKGIWAPCLTYCEEDDLFYLVYGVMNSTNAGLFDVNNYIITAKDLKGPWSEPVYVGSAGFDASLFHDDDGRKWITSLEWEFRDGYEQPGVICMVEYDPKEKKIIGYPKRIWTGGTDRGCIEGPHIYKHNGWYYIMCAEGGTGYGHCVTIGRSRNVWGPYERDPQNPIVTSCPENFNGRVASDYLHIERFNPDSILQKSGHASIVEAANGEVYLSHLCARPFRPELRCTLGRETSFQKMMWTEDGWLRMADGSNLAKSTFEGCSLPQCPVEPLPETEDFSGPLRLDWYTPRRDMKTFARTGADGWLTLRGQEHLSSLNQVSLLAKKLRSVRSEFTVRMRFAPEVYQHSAGLVLYYDNMDYAILRKYYSQTLGGPALGLFRVSNGQRTEYVSSRVACPQEDVWLKLKVEGRRSTFAYSFDGETYTDMAPSFDTSEFSDEFCKFGEFTGTFVGLACVDSLLHTREASFRDFTRKDDPLAEVE